MANTNRIPVGQILHFFTTGKDRSGRKHRIQSSSLRYIEGINFYSNKIVWAQLENGKRKKVY